MNINLRVCVCNLSAFRAAEIRTMIVCDIIDTTLHWLCLLKRAVKQAKSVLSLLFAILLDYFNYMQHCDIVTIDERSLSNTMLFPVKGRLTV